MLAAKGIEEIENALKISQAYLKEYLNSLIVKRKTSMKKLNEILEYLDVFNVLLIINNLETILDENIREFIWRRR